jgi:hypothetical protein
MTRRLFGAIGFIGLVIALAALPAQAGARAFFATPQRVPHVGTSQYSQGPSLAALDGRLYMAWKGAGNDHGIYWNYREAGHWSAQHRVAGAGTSSRPSIEASNARLCLAWRGVGADDGIYWTSSIDPC